MASAKLSTERLLGSAVQIFKRQTSHARQIQVTQTRTEYTWPGYGSRYGFTNWKMKKDFHKREIVKELYPQRMRLLAVKKNRILPVELRDIAAKEVEEMPRNSNPIRTVDRCVMTSRPKGCQREHRVSRIMWRHFADYNKMSGVTRAVW